MRLVKNIRNINIFTLLFILASLSLLFRLDAFVNNSDFNNIVMAEAAENVHDAPPALKLPSDDYQSPYGDDDLSAYDTKFSDTEVQLLQSLSKRRRSLEMREKQIIARESLLSATESGINAKIEELNNLKKELEKLLGTQSKLQESRMHSLVKIYESMKPKEAARIMDTLELNVLMDVLGRMKERKSASILANMDPNRAREVTIELAKQRNLPQGCSK